MPYHFGPDSLYPSSDGQLACTDDRGSAFSKASPDVPDYLYDFDINGQSSPYLNQHRLV